MDYEKKNEIPFGAIDSELVGFEYTIPEGFEAEIKDGKVVVRKAASEDDKIREWCVSHFRECVRLTNDNAEYQEYLNNKVIPWLEKQGKRHWIKKQTAMNWIQKIRYYNLMDRLVQSQKETIDKLITDNVRKDSLISLLRKMEKDSAEHVECTDKELSEVKKKYEKVCKENRHLEREIERLKLARL